jgi:hypothetical protein
VTDDSAAGWVPEFEGQRPPFQPGNTVGRQVEAGNELAAKHGAYSPRRVDPLARDLVDLMLDDPALGYLKAPAYRPELWAWARAEARVQLLEEYLGGRVSDDEAVPDPGDERVRSAELALHRAEARAASGRNRLGLNPLARAKLGKDVAQGQAANADVARIMAQLERLELDGTLPPGWSDALGGEES